MTNKETACFEYGAKEIDYLSSACPELGDVIRRMGKIEREMTPDPFECLASSVVGQQISGVALKTVWSRLENLTGGVSADSVAALCEDEIKACGMSLKKAQYIKSLAEVAKSGGLDKEKLQKMTDKEVVRYLTQFCGIGRWTAEMFLIFCLQRQDVMSFGDFGLRKGLSKLLSKEVTQEMFDTYAKKFSPHGTVASLYLWELASEK